MKTGIVIPIWISILASLMHNGINHHYPEENIVYLILISICVIHSFLEFGALEMEQYFKSISYLRKMTGLVFIFYLVLAIQNSIYDVHERTVLDQLALLILLMTSTRDSFGFAFSV